LLIKLPKENVKATRLFCNQGAWGPNASESTQLGESYGTTVRQLMLRAVSSEIFNGIELDCIGWQKFPLIITAVGFGPQTRESEFFAADPFDQSGGSEMSDPRKERNPVKRLATPRRLCRRRG